jgi:hypothetical protein
MFAAGKDATEEFDMVHERQVIQQRHIDQVVAHNCKLSKSRHALHHGSTEDIAGSTSRRGIL